MERYGIIDPVDITLRPAESNDRAAIRHVLAELHPDTAAATTLPLIRQQSENFVATDGDDVVGVAVVTFVDCGHSSYGMLEELVVGGPSRGRGVGTALLGRCLRWLEVLGAEVTFVSALDKRVAGYYLSAGFTRCSGPWLFKASSDHVGSGVGR